MSQAPSLHQRILTEIEGRILSGEWPPGHRIPFEHELCAQFGCARMTVSKVLTRLAAAGLIERRRKAGSFVTRPRRESAVLEIQDIVVEVAALGEAYRFEIRRRTVRRASAADRRRLELPPDSRLLELECHHFAGARPYCLEERLISLEAAPEAADQAFQTEPPGPWLLSHAPWTAAEHRIRAVEAGAEAAKALALAPGAACLVIERRTWRGEQPVTHVRLTYPGSGRELVARFTPKQAG